MTKYLQLYLDVDFIIPVGIGESGNVNKYIDQQAIRRLWLYFSHISNGGMYESSESCKSNFEAGKEGFYGDFWKHIGENDSIPGEPYKYLDLLELSRTITNIREWSNVTLCTETPDVVLNFSTVIPLKARRVFADYVEEKLGKIRSYGIEMNDLLSSKIVSDHRTMSPSFGDQLMIMQSSGKDILLSGLTWCGDQFMQGAAPTRLAQKGREYVKEALVRMVVDAYERNYHYLLSDQIEKECSYQIQFADGWLSERNGGEDITIDNFHYSFEPEKRCTPIRVDGKQLSLIEQENIRTTLNDVSKFCRENIVNNLLHIVFIGDAFKEEVFLKGCVSVTSSEGKYTFFNDNALQEALGEYRVKYSLLTEDLRNLERLFMDKENERQRIRTYVQNANFLRGLRDKVSSSISRLKSEVDSVNERNSGLVFSWKVCMKRSAFDEAGALVGKMMTCEKLSVCENAAFGVLEEIERCNSMLVELKQLKDVQPIVDAITKAADDLKTMAEKADELRTLPDTLKSDVEKYKDLYPRYQELRKQFDSEPTLTGRRDIVEEMKNLTMEEMPLLDIEPVTGTISAKVFSSSGFWGIGGKKTLELKVCVEKPLPCCCVLVICSEPLCSIPEGRVGIYAIDVDKGAVGKVIEEKMEFQSLGFTNKTKNIYVKFWPREDEKVPINRFRINGDGLVRL